MSELTSKTIAELRDGFGSGELHRREIAESYNGVFVAAARTPTLTSSRRRTCLAAADAADTPGCNLGLLVGISAGSRICLC